ncbi:phosphonate C-P lyase system protein PhnH [Serratia sp. AKBS12]|uniref:phosphonate C-P lyase system protein PhnH n=1 Tax=Serratia sp. AKBS12 TaxID=2974597 RepID=UPI00216619DF|nr:phosphonate C-P lyase system protein PhnH [Serratia sp. AKBS12]MCS3405974.1 phosphonate C-P lyase system protein PhnH [Serratia sp. AKBS12]HEI8867791.1 phosphonate C-P lyase system protein PhnH [Serratia odorifera]
MSLLTGFAQPIEQAQHAFRLILKALSEPGVTVTLGDGPVWPPLNAADTAALLTLADGETPIQLCPALNCEQVLTNIRFHTGAPLADSPAAIRFALWDDSLQAVDLSQLPYGSDISPEFGATLLVQVSSLTAGAPLRLSGPGIERQRLVSPALPAALRDYLLERPHRFPLGIDVLLTCGEQLIAIPRTTHLEAC